MLPFIQRVILYPNFPIRNTFACSKSDAEDRAKNLETFFYGVFKNPFQDSKYNDYCVSEKR